jgi:hypothetical protein
MECMKWVCMRYEVGGRRYVRDTRTTHEIRMEGVGEGASNNTDRSVSVSLRNTLYSANIPQGSSKRSMAPSVASNWTRLILCISKKDVFLIVEEQNNCLFSRVPCYSLESCFKWLASILSSNRYLLKIDFSLFCIRLRSWFWCRGQLEFEHGRGRSARPLTVSFLTGAGERPQGSTVKKKDRQTDRQTKNLQIYLCIN